MMEETRIDGPLGVIQLFRGGAGDPLVYLHSAGGETPMELLEDLATDHDVIAPVFPGFGESEGIEEIDSMEDAVFHLLDVWELLGLDAPTVVGVSLGGWMAVELATRYPEKVGALVLVNAVGLYLADAPIAELFGRSPAELAVMLFADQSHPIAQAMHAMAEFTGDVGKDVEIPLELIVPMWKALGATAKLAWDPYMHNPKLRARLRRVNVPDARDRGRARRPRTGRARTYLRRRDHGCAAPRDAGRCALAPDGAPGCARRARARLPRRVDTALNVRR